MYYHYHSGQPRWNSRTYSKFWNFPLDTLNYNDQNFVLLVAVVLLQSICETLNNIPHKYFHLTRGVPLRMWNYVSSANAATPVLHSFYTLVPTKNKLRFFVPHILVHDSGKLLETANHKFCSFSILHLGYQISIYNEQGHHPVTTRPTIYAAIQFSGLDTLSTRGTAPWPL